MARKREGLAPRDAERLFGRKLGVLLGERPRASNPTLDLLTGIAPRSLERLDPEKTETRGHARVGRTVYLSARETETIDALVKEWSSRAQRRVSRSELVRQAVRLLQREGIGTLLQEETNHAGDT